METPSATARPLTLSPRQAAYELAVSPSFLYRLMSAGAIPAPTVGKLARITWADLVAYVEPGRVERPAS